jgi:hypothetical protein
MVSATTITESSISVCGFVDHAASGTSVDILVDGMILKPRVV